MRAFPKEIIPRADLVQQGIAGISPAIKTMIEDVKKAWGGMTDFIAKAIGPDLATMFDPKTNLKELQDESPKGEIQERTRALAIDMEARMLALYQLAALKAKKADDIAQIQKVWTRPLMVYNNSFMLISTLISAVNKNPDIAHLLETIGKLRDQVHWLYDLHADQ